MDPRAAQPCQPERAASGGGQQGIDRQVCGGWVDMFGYELPAAEGEAWSRLINDAMLAAKKSQPAFVPLATVPLQDGARAAAVLKSAVAAGFPGAMIGTLPRGIGSVLDAADLDAFWAAADECGAAIKTSSLASLGSNCRRVAAAAVWSMSKIAVTSGCCNWTRWAWTMSPQNRIFCPFDENS